MVIIRIVSTHIRTCMYVRFPFEERGKRLLISSDIYSIQPQLLNESYAGKNDKENNEKRINITD